MTELHSHPPVILASSSPYRRELLQRLGLDFETISPDVDETPLSGETAADLSRRLARMKALAVAAKRPDALIVGSDQVLALGDEMLGKPGNHDNAVAQLSKLSGQAMTFYTSVCLASPGGEETRCDVVTTQVRFRQLTHSDISAYLAVEPAYDCAGSCKAEGLGISLCESIQSDDPTALIGLPLIKLTGLLRDYGLRLPCVPAA